ncbi:MAG: YicC family protein [Myxococcota bacterium]|nr:YicC family protein [Myxococcota bacterium]
MIQSMTGFGRASFQVEGHGFEVEARSVNHRHLDIRVRLPRLLSAQEPSAKLLIQECVSRGKVDVSVNQLESAGVQADLKVDQVLAAQYVDAARELGSKHGLNADLDVATLLSMPGVAKFVDAGVPDEALASVLMEGLASALAELVEMRAVEGGKLAAELVGRLGNVLNTVAFFEERSGLVVEAARERLRKRTEQIRQDSGLFDEARLHQEIVIAADRLDITEELVRLRSHVSQFTDIMKPEGDSKPVGRRLEFLIQEMLREANTVGSKASDAALAHQVVELKSELERLREQVLNVA